MKELGVVVTVGRFALSSDDRSGALHPAPTRGLPNAAEVCKILVACAPVKRLTYEL